MDTETIKQIAEDRLMSDLCVNWYLEIDENKKKEIYQQILELYKKINGYSI